MRNIDIIRVPPAVETHWSRTHGEIHKEYIVSEKYFNDFSKTLEQLFLLSAHGGIHYGETATIPPVSEGGCVLL